jgi:hypothetical protein
VLDVLIDRELIEASPPDGNALLGEQIFDALEALAAIPSAGGAEEIVADALETARQRAMVLFQSYALGVSLKHKRGADQFKHDVKTFADELADALKHPVSVRAVLESTSK